MYQIKGDTIGMKGRTFTVTYTVVGAVGFYTSLDYNVK